MAAERQPREQPNPGLQGTAKAAALLLAMNKELASRVLKHFDEEEVKIIAQAATDLGSISKDAIDTIIEEFANDLKNGVDLMATSQKVQELLEGVLTPAQIEALMAQTGTKSGHGVWQQLQKIPDIALSQYLQKEHPQVIALVLSRAAPITSAAILKLLDRAQTTEVTARMLSLRPVAERPLALLEFSFIQDILLNRRSDSDLSPHTRMADVLNKMDRKLMDECLQAIGVYNEKDAELIRQQLFTFDDLGKLTPASLVTVFDLINVDVIVKALFGVPKPLVAKILEAVPTRARRSIEVELESGPAVKTKEALKAQRTIADAALELLERGAIEVHSEETEDEAVS